MNMKKEYVGNNRLLIGIVLSVLLYWLFAQSMLNIAPIVQKSLSLSAGETSLATSVAALFCAIFIVLAGGLADKFGRVKLTYIGLVFNVIGSVLLVISSDATLFIAGRVFQGLSAACIMPATMALLTAYYEGSARQRAVSFWVIGSFGGSGLNSLFGGVVATTLGWRYVFIIGIVVSILSAILILGTPESKATGDSVKAKFDYLGLAIFIVSMISLNIAISKGKEFGWLSVYTLGLVLIVVVGLIVFYKVETSKNNSFIDFSLFKNRGYLGSAVSNFLINAGAGTMIIINSYLQQARGLSASTAGLLSLGYLVLVLSTIRVGEKMLQKSGAKKPMIIGGIVGLLGYIFMSLTFLQGTMYLACIFIGFMLFGLGLGLYATPSTDTALSSVPREKVGVAAGIYKMGSSLGGAIGIAISASVYNGLSAGGNYVLATNVGLLVNIVFSIITTLSVILIIPNNKK